MEGPGMRQDLPLLPSWSSVHAKHRRDKEKEQRMKEQRMKDQRMEDQRMKDQRMKDWEMKDQRMKDQRMKDLRMKDLRMKDLRMKDQRMMMKKDTSQLKYLPPIPTVPSGTSLPSPRAVSHVSKWIPAPAASPPGSSGPAARGHRAAPSRWHPRSGRHLDPRGLEAGKDGIYKVHIHEDEGPDAEQRLRARPELFWSVLKEPQMMVLGGYSFRPPLAVPPSHHGSRSAPWQPPRSGSMETSHGVSAEQRERGAWSSWIQRGSSITIGCG
ncbi:uncharacterized protein AAGF69_017375 [Amazona ochrocephala]